jgi:hypothetical protein
MIKGLLDNAIVLDLFTTQKISLGSRGIDAVMESYFLVLKFKLYDFFISQ